jgi:hypothetical protein
MCAINNNWGNCRQSGETEEGMMFKRIKYEKLCEKTDKSIGNWDDYDDLKHISSLILDKEFFFFQD